MKKKYWFYLEPYVYLEVKKDSFLLFNTLDKSSVEGCEYLLLKKMEEIKSPENCGVVSLEYENNSIISDFVNDVKEKYMGDIIPQDASDVKPIQPLSLPLIKENLETFNFFKESTDTDLVKYLSEVSIYLSNSCKFKCKYCDLLYTQMPCCTKQQGVQDLTKIIDFLNHLIDSNFSGIINLIVRDIKDIHALSKYLHLFRQCMYVFIHMKSIEEFSFNCIDISNDKFKVIVDYDSIKNDANWLSLLKLNSLKNLIIAVRNVEEFDFFVNAFKEDDFKIQIRPFFTGENLSFFQKNVFLMKEDILCGVKNMQNIHQNMILNSNFFGKIVVSSDGYVFSNVNDKEPIGHITESIAKIVHSALFSKKSSWRKLRNFEMCRDCLYQYLCPPISNYEYVMGNKPLCFKNL